jgi:hypothetical protein
VNTPLYGQIKMFLGILVVLFEGTLQAEIFPPLYMDILEKHNAR